MLESSASSVLGDEESAFDDFVIDSKAYRRVFVRQQSKAQLRQVQGAEEEVDTMVLLAKRQTTVLDRPQQSFGIARNPNAHLSTFRKG